MRFSAALYRALVVALTIGWAVASLSNVVLRRPRFVLGFDRIAMALTALASFAIVLGVLGYARTHRVAFAWTGLHLAGALALRGYLATSSALCFMTGMLTLALMHVYSPNRLEVGR